MASTRTSSLPIPMKTLGFLGPEGTFTDIAAQQWLASNIAKPQTQKKPFLSFFDLFNALSTQETDTIIVPLENSIEGNVASIMDLLLIHPNIYIYAEQLCPITHCLLTKKAIKNHEITLLLSHPQPLAQCQHYLFDQFSHVPKEATLSTAAAAKILTTQSTYHNHKTDTIAIIGPAHLSTLYNLHVLDRKINDVQPNVTRFVIISHHHAPPTGQDKTSIVIFPRQNEPGTLATILKYFSDHDINLTRIESRPAKKQLGHYVFFIDFDGHRDDPIIQTILSNVAQHNRYKWLGSYPVHRL